MNSKKTLEIILFLRCSARKRENAAHDLAGVMELLSKKRLPQDIPLHWNLPVQPLLSEKNDGREDEEDTAAAVLREIQRRTAANRDTLLPMGYSGAFHSLLTDDELRQEYNWAFRNPGRIGFEDVFGIKPMLMMPPQMDFLRPSARSFYNNTECSWLVVPEWSTRKRDSQAGLQTLELLDHGNMYYLPLLDLAPPLDEALRPVKKLSKKRNGPLGILFDFTRGNSGDDLIYFYDLIDRIQQKTEVRFVQLSRWLHPDRRQALAHPESGFSIAPRVPGTMLPYISLPHNPAERVYRQEAGRKRFLIRQQGLELESEPYREIICRVSSLWKQSETVENRPNPEPYETPVDRTLIADMPGTVVIKESDFEAEFLNGRFSNIISKKGPLLTGELAASYINLEGKILSFDNAGVYSFESEAVRGLREALLLESPSGGSEGRLIIDYMFISEYPSLFISIDIRYPDLGGKSLINSYAPLELPLFRFDEDDSLTAAGMYPDGTQYSFPVHPAEAVYDLPGRRFLLTKNDINFTIAFPLIDDLPVEIVPARVKQEKKGAVLLINPKGSYKASNPQFVSGYTEHFTVMISAVSGSPVLNPVPATVLHYLQKPWLGKTEK